MRLDRRRQLTTLTLSQWKDLAAIGATLIGLLALLKAVFEYVAQGSQKRADRFFEMRLRFDENTAFQAICGLLDSGDSNIRGVPAIDKHRFLGFFEDIELLCNSGLMKEAVANYMFGYYTIKCWNSAEFWEDINRDSDYWAGFRSFAFKMRRVEETFIYSPRRFRV